MQEKKTQEGRFIKMFDFNEEVVKAQGLVNEIMKLSAIMAESVACMLCDEIAKQYGRDAIEVAAEVKNMVETINAEYGAY